MATCDELRTQLASLKNDGILLVANRDIKYLKQIIADQEYADAVDAVNQNLQQQCEIESQMGDQGCNINDGDANDSSGMQP